MTDSKSLPDLPNKKNKTNWVEKRGGLPSYINRIAKHLHTEKGMETGHAIATAVNTVKKWCSGGTVSSTKGPEKSQHVTAATKAKACAAVAEWNAMKGTAGMNAAQDRTAYSDEEYAMVLAQEMEADLKLTQDLEEDPEFDMDAYELALSAERADSGLDPDTGKALELAIFDESKHRRDLLGKFRKMMNFKFVDTKSRNSDGDSGGDTDNDGDGSRWAILGERGEVEYYDTQAEAEEAGEGQEALEITKDDKRYHVFYPGGHEIDVDSYDSYDAMMEDWDTGLEAGEAALHSPDPDNDGDSGVDTDNDGDGEAEWKDQLHALEVDRQAHEYEIVSQAVPAYIDVNVDQDAGFELVDTRNNRTYTLEPTDDNEWTLYSEESGREWKYTKLDQAVYGFIKAISPYQ